MQFTQSKAEGLELFRSAGASEQGTLFHTMPLLQTTSVHPTGHFSLVLLGLGGQLNVGRGMAACFRKGQARHGHIGL